MRHFKAIVENGYQMLQSPEGKKVPRLTMTHIFQDISMLDRSGTCEFILLVNYKTTPGDEPCHYDHITGKLTMPDGEVLPVEILEFRDRIVYSDIPTVRAKCTVILPYETNHRNSENS